MNKDFEFEVKRIVRECLDEHLVYLENKLDTIIEKLDEDRDDERSDR
jgi:hypothetical protein